MIVIKKANDLHHHLEQCRERNEDIGFVPTMGALHDGHLSLLKTSLKENKLSVCSIFVNPAQFNDPTDFKKYPSTIDDDILKLETNGCDILFVPSVAEIYPDGFEVKKKYELGYLDNILEGEFRPGHFQGVCMAVERLLLIVQPDKLYLGQKDYQQCMIITRLAQLMGLEERVEIRICPILREKDGLAMSSRNMRLSKEERAKAPALYETLVFLQQNIRNGSLQDLKKQATDDLQKKGFKPDYVEIANAETLKPINEWDARTNILGLVAAYIDGVRLIDNMMLN
jgi:pantoate--beta-alanine ligase